MSLVPSILPGIFGAKLKERRKGKIIRKKAERMKSGLTKKKC